MNHEEYRKTLNEIFKYDGLEGLIRYFSHHENLNVEEAEAKCAAWGYPFSKEEPVQLSLFPDKEVTDYEHEISQEDLDNNPELVDEGIKVGDMITLPVVNLSEEEMNLVKEDIRRKQPGFFAKWFGKN